jgi:hypothetical protein
MLGSKPPSRYAITLRRTEAISTKPTLGSSDRSTICEFSPVFTSTQLRSIVLSDMANARSEPGARRLEPLGCLAVGMVSTQMVNSPVLQAPTSSRLQARGVSPVATQASTSSTHAWRHQRPSDPA